MSVILAIETSTELASAALLCGQELASLQSAGAQTHSQSILPMVQKLLAQAGLSLKQCDAVAFGAGPGSFTGVRTACGVAQGLAFGAGLPLVPIVTLEAMAQACREQSGASSVLSLLDARMEEVYWAQYRFDNGWQEVIAPTLSAAAAVVPAGAVIACGNGLAAYAGIFGSREFSQASFPSAMPHAIQVAWLAQSAFKEGKTVGAHEAQPLYLRNKVAFTSAERIAKAAA